MKKIESMKKTTIAQRIKRIENELDHMERGLYAGMTTEYIADYVLWLYKYKHISKEEMYRLVDRITYVIENCI